MVSASVREFILALAYDVRHANQGDRESATFGVDDFDRVTYRGVQVLWPTFMVQLGLLRACAAYQPTSKSTQASLYRLEACAESALNAFNPAIAEKCMKWLGGFPMLSNDYLIDYISDISYRYIANESVGQSRFKALPQLLDSTWFLSTEYQAYAKAMNKIAKDKACSPHELRDFSEWPPFKW